MSDKTYVITPVATISYPHLDVAVEDDQGKKKFSATFVFTSDKDISALKEAALAAAEAAYPGKAREMIQKGQLRWPFRKGEEKDYEAGSTFINARTEQKPGCVFSHAEPGTNKPARVPDEKIRETFYPGAQVRASLRAFTYDRKGNKGVSFALNNVQYVGDGKRLDSRKAAEDEFTPDLNQAPADLDSLL